MTDDLIKRAEAAAHDMRNVAETGGYPDIPSILLREGFAVITALLARVKELEGENFALAAQQCLFSDGSGLTGDDWGHQYCAMKRRAEQAEATLAHWRSEADHAYYIQEARISEAEAALAQRVEVKPLVWDQPSDGRWCQSRTGSGWEYLIRDMGEYFIMPFPWKPPARYPTLEAAKAAAQADYEARIRSAIREGKDASPKP